MLRHFLEMCVGLLSLGRNLEHLILISILELIFLSTCFYVFT